MSTMMQVLVIISSIVVCWSLNAMRVMLTTIARNQVEQAKQLGMIIAELRKR